MPHEGEGPLKRAMIHMFPMKQKSEGYTCSNKNWVSYATFVARVYIRIFLDGCIIVDEIYDHLFIGWRKNSWS